MSDLVKEARAVAHMYASVGHRHGVEDLLTRLADSLEGVTDAIDQADLGPLQDKDIRAIMAAL